MQIPFVGSFFVLKNMICTIEFSIFEITDYFCAFEFYISLIVSDVMGGLGG